MLLFSKSHCGVKIKASKIVSSLFLISRLGGVTWKKYFNCFLNFDTPSRCIGRHFTIIIVIFFLTAELWCMPFMMDKEFKNIGKLAIFVVEKIGELVKFLTLDLKLSIRGSYTKRYMYTNVQTFLKNGPTLASYFVYFRTFQTNNTSFTANQCEKCPSSIRHRD